MNQGSAGSLAAGLSTRNSKAHAVFIATGERSAHGNSLRCRSRGVTLIEMLIVVAIVAVVAGVSFPSVASGLDNVRLRSAADSITGFLNSAMSRVERKQQAVEIVILPQERALVLYSNEPGFTRRLELPDGIKIAGDESRQFLLLPGGTPPAMNIDIYNQRGTHKLIHIDPVTGVPQS